MYKPKNKRESPIKFVWRHFEISESEDAAEFLPPTPSFRPSATGFGGFSNFAQNGFTLNSEYATKF